MSNFDLLNKVIKENNLSGYVIPTTDEFQSEYPAAYSRRFEFLSGLACSNGLLFILSKHNILFTDARYLNAARTSLNDVEVFDFAELKTFNWQKYLKDSARVGYDPKLFSNNFIKQFSAVNLVPLEENLVDKIWENKPLMPSTDAFIYGIEYSGLNTSLKIEQLRQIMKDKQYPALLLSSPESICWLLNIRARDNEFSPIMLAYCYLDYDQIVLFTSKRIFEANKTLKIIIKSNNELESFLKNINKKICIDNNASIYLENIIIPEKIIKDKDPVLLLRALKNQTEIEGAKKAHITDARSLIEFLTWFYNEGVGLSEYDIGIKLTEFRAGQANYIMDSFAPICGFKENGAKIHYRANSQDCAIIKGEGLFLIDSGAHYFGGTTDITRTLLLGKPTSCQKEYYTRVLKGHIALATIKFPKGITGSHLDILARQYLWQVGADYAHGTGHGVGNALSVHEGPMKISLHDKLNILQEGMILSNEPGYYKDNEFGIRIENLQYIKNSDSYPNFLEFEQLTLVPYCFNLIEKQMLTKEEIKYLESYYLKIENLVKPLLSVNAKDYLAKELSKLSF